ncbi:Detected protein of confused Function [Hibiscus syriacus]|uniref:Detected protein of confused Function n=1 Tax=Hibiscus syriacus TaxID=106335 RepID=A0A6A3BPT5_HIBSY|nr:Detected protein of confused Function [Hibiscus syriacus]
MSSRREWFHHYEPISGGSVYIYIDHALEIIGVRTIKLKMYDQTIKVVRDVRHVKGLKKNLLSYGLLDNNASKIETWKGIMKVFRGALMMMKGEKIAANLYMLKGETLLEAEASVPSCSLESVILWHQKLIHMSEQGMKVLVEQKLLPGLTKISLTLYEHCITITSLGGEKYFVSFIDDYSRRCSVYPIKKKSDAFSTFKNFKARVKLDSRNKIKCFRTDNGREYTSEDFDDFYRKECIKRQFTVVNTPQQNGVAERMNKTLFERTRAMLRDASLEKSFWAEVVNTVCYLVNRAPSTAIELKTPMEMWTDKPADYSNLHGYLLWDPTARKVIINMDVIFVEDKLQRKEDDDSAEKLNADPCAYFKRFGDNYFVILLLYVDDMLVAGPNKDHIEELKAQLAREFEMKDLGSTNKILGMQIHRDRSNRKIWLSQKNYLKKILSLFSMQDCKPISTSLPINIKLSSSMSPSSEEERMKMSQVQYASAVGSLMFGMICTRPDITQAVGVVSRYMANPCKEHWNTVKRVLRYIKGTSNIALCYKGSNLVINGYVDSDYARDLDKSKSTTGYVFKIVGGAESWISKLQSVVATSTTEANYVAATQASKEAIWLKMLLEELGHNQEPIVGSWIAPPQGKLKFNVDAAIKDCYGDAGIGGVFRDCTRSCLICFSRSIGLSDPTGAELTTILEACKLFHSSRWCSQEALMIESDSNLAVCWIKNPKLSSYGDIVSKCVDFFSRSFPKHLESRRVLLGVLIDRALLKSFECCKAQLILCWKAAILDGVWLHALSLESRLFYEITSGWLLYVFIVGDHVESIVGCCISSSLPIHRRDLVFIVNPRVLCDFIAYASADIFQEVNHCLRRNYGIYGNMWFISPLQAFNAAGKDISESLKPVKKSLVSMLHLQLERGEAKNEDSDKTEYASAIHENDPEPSTASDKYSAPSKPQLEQGGCLLADGDCQDHTNCSTGKDSFEQDGESKSVETTSDNTIAEVTAPAGQPQGPRETTVREEADLVDGTKGESTIYSQTQNGVNNKDSDAVAEIPNIVSGIHSSCPNKANRKKMMVI